ncbi:MAG TPA: TetR/AcrR family transcriptional regulator [Acidimicrobiales bacterium]|jgi:AcrR family transcriptional regulator|nr:TetR/AcrR family transcriptional regulator [Acidimicrobiales bacterium]
MADGTGRPRRRGRPAGRRSEDTRADVLAAARAQFSAAGYERTSLADIARAAGITSRALYHYVDSKPELFAEVTASVLDRLGEEVLRRVLPEADTRARLRALIEVFRALHREDPTLVAFFGVVVLEARWNPDVRAGLGERLGDDAGVTAVLNRSIVAVGLEGGDIAPDVDPAGAVALIEAVGAGITLLAGADGAAYEATLDVLDRLVAGTLFVVPPG